MRESSNNKSLGGFDAAISQRQHDHLNRWPFAREIYTSAITCPKDWSVRIGVYGEWGTGKTSVLKFIATMAEKDGHVPIWFDPWEHSDKTELWKSFVLQVYGKLEERLGGIPQAGDIRRKELLTNTLGIFTKVTKALKESAGDALDSGLELLKKKFALSHGNFQAARNLLGEKRVILLIDDLDRTAAELVPEILFALKELMDVPGFSFICAFDPVVVGKVLRQHHRGFGDGLKFLDKIIDYPRWLPPPTIDGLTRLALAERNS